jgi:hypothetical protein
MAHFGGKCADAGCVGHIRVSVNVVVGFRHYIFHPEADTDLAGGVAAKRIFLF